jgi:multidrug efflux pump subunit AcrA (membrane-fusion protein)
MWECLVSVTPTGNDRSFAGRVWQVAPVIDPQSRQGEVRISVPYDVAIRPGGFAEAKIEAGSTAAPLLPQSAVLSDELGNYVYVINSKNLVERRNVKVGSVSDQGRHGYRRHLGSRIGGSVGRAIPQSRAKSCSEAPSRALRPY